MSPHTPKLGSLPDLVERIADFTIVPPIQVFLGTVQSQDSSMFIMDRKPSRIEDLHSWRKSLRELEEYSGDPQVRVILKSISSPGSNFDDTNGKLLHPG